MTRIHDHRVLSEKPVNEVSVPVGPWRELFHPHQSYPARRYVQSTEGKRHSDLKLAGLRRHLAPACAQRVGLARVASHREVM